MELALTASNGTVVAGRCRLADDPLTRTRGLLGREAMEPDEGLFVATSGIHTSFMRFPIDVVFLDADYAVVDIVHALKPWRVAVRRRAKALVELPAGACEALGLSVGDELRLGNAGAAGASGPGAAHAPTAPLRVALATGDRRFRRVASFLLARKGFEVDARRDLAEDGPAPDVVVLDATRSLAEAAKVVRRLSVESPETRVIVVSDFDHRGDGGGGEAPRTLTVLPKWDAFDRLVGELGGGDGNGDGRG